ncbi:TetR/AcrR family transcriptional regulator [Reyranella sp.]|uniref:TetR/AcrR family transcriptional regulator n=3 Tax=Reyranella sp. TaxID=1929291 RepID=UPI003D10D9D4
MGTDHSVISEPSSAESGGRTRRPEVRGPEIARAALDLFVTKGFAATKLEDVARAAGVSKGLPYLYFKNKEELFKAVIVEAIGEPLLRANDMVDAFDGPTTDLLRELVAKFREFAESPLGGVIKLILAEAGNFPDVARFYCSNFDLHGRELFAKVLRRGIARGEFRPVDDIEMSAILLAQPLAMHSVWLRSLAPHDESLPADSDRFYEAYLDFVLRGLRP